MRRLALAVLAVALTTSAADAQTFNSGSTGADGAVNLAVNSGTTTLQVPPSGVFHFTTVTVRFGSTLAFKRNTANTPVTILASGNVVIDQGTIDISGVKGGDALSGSIVTGGNAGAGGAGGFDGGTGAVQGGGGGAGRGPGGGTAGTAAWAGGGGGGFFTAGTNGTTFAGSGAPGQGGAPYSDQTLLPLIGGSGGGGGGANFGSTGGGGGGGGGALLIASSGTINFISGTIKSRGGDGGNGGSGLGPGGAGAGGAVRLLATSITGTATIDVRAGNQAGGNSSGGAGSAGRVRTEAFTNTVAVAAPGTQAGAVTSGPPTSVALANAPTLAITAIGGVSAPTSPGGAFAAPDVTLPVNTTNPVTVTLAASNIPVGTIVTLNVIGQTGGYNTATSSPLTGTTASSTATATLNVPTSQPFVISASATYAVGGP